MKATQRLHELGQSLWLDNITRDLLTSGALKHYIDELSVTGLTFNPTIFDHAIKNSAAHDDGIRQKLEAGKSGDNLFFELAIEDITVASRCSPTWRWSRRPGPTANRCETRRSRSSSRFRRLTQKDLVRGQFRGYRKEPGVAPDSKVETFAALRLEIASWSWQGVPFFIRAGKRLPVTCTEVTVRSRPALRIFPSCPGMANHFRFRISPEMTIALGATVMDAEDKEIGQPVELLASRRPGAEEMDAYERVLGDAMSGDRTLFARGLRRRGVAHRRSGVESGRASLRI